jgi:hypothetical protein
VHYVPSRAFGRYAETLNEVALTGVGSGHASRPVTRIRAVIIDRRDAGSIMPWVFSRQRNTMAARPMA